MRANEILLELGDAIYPYTQVGNKLVATLRDGRVLDLAFWRTGTELEIIFGVNDETEMTGGGDQFKIMATVIDMITRHLGAASEQRTPNRKPITTVYFTAAANERSRVKYYTRRLVPVVTLALRAEDPSWTFSTDLVDGQQAFIWRR